MENEIKMELENEELEIPEGFVEPGFVVKPKSPVEENVILEEIKPEVIPTTAASEINQSMFPLPEELEAELEEMKPMAEEEEEEIEIIPNGYSGMYILVTVLMLAMVGLSILGFVLS